MSNAALMFLAGLGSGALRQYRLNQDEDRLSKADERAQEEHDARMAELQRQNQVRNALSNAAKPVAVDNNAATVTGVSANPTVYDNADVAASDVRQANRMAAGDTPMQQNADGTPVNPTQATSAAPVASATPTIAVAGKAYPDQGSAQSAADAANTPQAIRARQVAAVQGLDPELALKLQSQSTQVDQATQAAADAAWRRKVAGAMLNGGHQGLADLVSNSEQGPMAGVKLQAVPSADGKTVTYNKVGPDGTLTPTGLTFTNDGDGLARAAAALDQAISPADRVKMAQTDAKNALEAKKTGAEIQELGDRGGYYRAATANMGTKQGNAISEPDKLELENINAQRKTINTAITNARAQGMFDENGPQAKVLKKQLADLDIRQQQIAGKYQGGGGQAAPAPAAADPLNLRKASNASTPAASGRGINDDNPAGILSHELEKAQARLAAAKTDEDRTRAQGDIDAIQKEAKANRLTLTAAPPPTPAVTAARVGVPAPAPAPVPAPAAPVPAPVAPADRNVIGKQLDAARAALSTLQANRPAAGIQNPRGSNGQAAIDNYVAQVAQAKKRVADLEQAYQAAVGPVAPYIGQGRSRPAAMNAGL